MAVVYVIYSSILDKYYIGSCTDFSHRLRQHRNKELKGAFTSKVNDWEIFFKMDDLQYAQARKIERHIKRMKSRKFIEDLIKYPELMTKLKLMYRPMD